VEAPRSAAAQDDQLRLRLAAGDEGALAEAYDLYAPTVFGLAVRVTADEQGARDVTQEVFVSLWERPLAFDPRRGSLKVWLSLLAHRRAVDWVRKESRWRRPPERAWAVDTSPAVEDGLLDAELAHSVKRAVGALPPPLREAIELAYYGGRTYREVAIVLGIPEGTVKSRIRSALARVGQDLERSGVIRG
jgi:RNA polymerase sigma factor (sigma-70 family)